MSIRIGRIRDIDIKVNYSWFLIFLIVTWSLATAYLPYQFPNKSNTYYWGIGAVSAITVYFSILIHELAHSIVAKQNGLGINSITLHFFGGVSEINEEINDPKTEAVMAFVGPLSSLIIGGVLLAISIIFGANLPDYMEAIAYYSGYVNIVLAFFNLIPAFPMDGGRVFRAILWAHNGNIVKSTRMVSVVARFISILFIGLGLLLLFNGDPFDGFYLAFLGIFINNSSQMGLSQTIISNALGEMHVRDVMTREVHSVGPNITINCLIEEWFNVYKHQRYPVTQNGEIIGIVTNEDVRKVDPYQRSTVTVGEVMSKKVDLVFASPDDKTSDAWLKMAKNNVGRLLVVENDKLVGIITRSDINRVIQMKTQFSQ